MGESALKSHIVSKRSKERTPSLSNIASLLTPHQGQSAQIGKASNELASKETTSNEPARKKQSSVDQLFVKSTAISTEICWVSNLVTLKYSLNSFSNLGTYFPSCSPIVILQNDFNVDVPRLVKIPISV